MNVRRARREDAPVLMRLFYETVHAVNIRDYSPEQVDAWAPADQDTANWSARQETRITFVAEEEGRIVGFAEYTRDGHIDRFYCHRDCQGRGTGTALLSRIVADAERAGIERLTVDASITARPFFERRGFRVVAPQEVERRGATFLNYRMERRLSDAG